MKIVKKVIGFSFPESLSDFFCLQKLNLKLPELINQYSEERTTLIFTCTRKDCQTTAEFLSQNCPFNYKPFQRDKFAILSQSIDNNRLKATLLKGIGFYHAGLSPDDRQKLEIAFLNGEIRIVVATSALASSEDLSAHLVIIKGTNYFINGSSVEYEESTVLQMLDIAGKSELDDCGCAIILTRKENETKYKRLVAGEKMIESNIYNFFSEIFMTEIERNAICCLNDAVDWVRSTFFYIRIHKNKQYYGLDPNCTEEQVDQKLKEICIKELNSFKKYELIEVNADGTIQATNIGRLMADHSISTQAMQQFLKLKGNENLYDLLTVLTKCKDLNQSVILKTADERVLSKFNTFSNYNRVIRFPLSGPIKSNEMKINVLIQVVLGCIPLPEDFPLLQKIDEMINICQILSNCLMDIAFIKATNLPFLLNCIILAKCSKVGLWENSRYVCNQINGVNSKIARKLANANFCSFEKIEHADPRLIENVCQCDITFGDHVIQEIKRIPKYEVTIENTQITSVDYSQTIRIKVNLTNWEVIANDTDKLGKLSCILLIGDQDNAILVKERIFTQHLIKLTGVYEKDFPIPASAASIFIHFIDEFYVGTDISLEYFPKYLLSHEQNSIRKIQEIKQFDDIFNVSCKLE
ncbi:probable ATP-dependent DNA helicase HFM1 [Tetranychus urticae]|uniref:DNA 3'-5' helicase n=1 Tax=Tetranychus urticae TaxID=32264 RepID=T1JVC1_TETUR|nr:probable ATP-dependent DNA helicase HFM1 [Tetranychus urticae]